MVPVPLVLRELSRAITLISSGKPTLVTNANDLVARSRTNLPPIELLKTLAMIN